MRRTLEILHCGNMSNFTVSKLSRATLYGSKRRVPVDGQGRECATAALTQDGQFILPKGSTAMLYLDEQGDTVERDALRHVDGDGNAADESQPQRIEPVSSSDFLDYAITRVHALDPVSVSSALDETLACDEIHRLTSPATAGRGQCESFLLKNDAGYFVLIGERNGFDFVGPDEADLTIADEDMDDELDFSMM